MSDIFLNTVGFDIKGLTVQQQTQQSILIKELTGQLSKKIDTWIEETLETKTKLKRPYTKKQLKRHKIELITYPVNLDNENYYYELRRNYTVLSKLTVNTYELFKSNK